MRLDRFLTLYFFRPLVKLMPRSNKPRVAIMMYHSISDPIAEKCHPYYETCTSLTTFAAHMEFLRDSNYQVITLDQAVTLLSTSHLSSDISPICTQSSVLSTQPSALSCKPLANSPQCLPLSPKPSVLRPKTPRIRRPDERIDYLSKQRSSYVVLTFDDGFEDFYTSAFPILHSLGFPSIVYLPTAAITDGEAMFKRKRLLTWNQVRELHSHGVSFGSHTVNHPQLADLSEGAVKMELSKSKDGIEQQLGERIQSFSYPYAFPEDKEQFVERIRELLQALCYQNGVTTKIGLSNMYDDPFFLKRIPINDFDDLLFFKVKIEGAYDWLYSLQKYYKLMKGGRHLNA